MSFCRLKVKHWRDVIINKTLFWVEGELKQLCKKLPYVMATAVHAHAAPGSSFKLGTFLFRILFFQLYCLNMYYLWVKYKHQHWRRRRMVCGHCPRDFLISLPGISRTLSTEHKRAAEWHTAWWHLITSGVCFIPLHATTGLLGLLIMSGVG